MTGILQPVRRALEQGEQGHRWHPWFGWPDLLGATGCRYVTYDGNPTPLYPLRECHLPQEPIGVAVRDLGTRSTSIGKCISSVIAVAIHRCGGTAEDVLRLRMCFNPDDLHMALMTGISLPEKLPVVRER